MQAEGMSNSLLYVARVLQEQLGDLLAGDLRTTLEFAAQHILVSRDASSKIAVGSRRKRKEIAHQRFHGNVSEEELMNPELWSTLPPQLLLLIFARLPLPGMKLLRLLSKVWKRRLDESDSNILRFYRDDSDFRQLWGEACTSKFALISPAQTLDSRVPAARRSQDRFWVSAFDSRTNKWHSASYKANPDWREVTVCACDGGLVCFAYKFEDLRQQMDFFTRAGRHSYQDMVRFVVWNPATGDEVAIPLLDADEEEEEDENDKYDYYDSHPPRKFHRLHTHPRAVHLSVDREKKQFELMVLNVTGQGDNYEVIVYDSCRGRWIIQEELPDRYYGYSHRCALRPLDLLPRTSKGFMLYELSEGKLSFIKETGIHVLGEEAKRIKGVSFAVTGDRVFLLHQNEGTQVYRIAEGLCDAGGLATVIKYHGCSPLDNLPDTDQYTLKLHSCQGFLMVSAFPKSSSRSHQQCHWFCDLLTGKWRKLPALAEHKRFKVDDIMCELQWNIILKQKRRLKHVWDYGT